MMNNTKNELVDEYFNVHVKCKLLGQGSQGIVFRTKDPDIAIKLVTDDSGKPVNNQALIDRYSKRLKNMRLLPLPFNLHLAAPVALLKDKVGYVMQLLSDMVPFSSFWIDGKTAEGISSDDIPDWLGRMPEDEAKKIVHYLNTGGLRRRLVALYKCASILARLHGNGFVYGDISPSNAYISKEIFSSEVWLIDADNLRFEMESGGNGVYTPKYGAPELVQGLDSGRPRTDCHAFAVMAFNILTMIHPFIGELVDNGGNRDWADDGFEDEDQEEKAYAGYLPWVDDTDDESNSTAKGLPRQLVLTNKMKELFQKTFGGGRTHFSKRPTIYHWPEALAQAADMTILCPNCSMSWFAENDGQQCPYCSSKKPNILLFQAYRWLGSGSSLKSPCWIIAKELPKPNEFLSLPERLFMPLSMTGGDITFLKLSFDNQKILIAKSEDCKMDVSVALPNENRGEFRRFISQVQLPILSMKTGFWLYIAGDEPRVISCIAKGITNEIK